MALLINKWKLCITRKCHVGNLTVIKRGICLTPKYNKVKTFQDNENDYYRQALGKLAPQYCVPPFIQSLGINNSLNAKLNAKFNFGANNFDKSPDSLYQAFVNLTKWVHQTSKNTTLENPEYKNLCFALSNNFSHLSDIQLCEILTCLTLWPSSGSPKSPCYKTVWNSLDNECSVRCSKWDNARLLQVAYLWYELSLNRITNYNYAMIDVLCSRIDSLDLHTVTHLLYFINMQRRISLKLMTRVEEQLLSLDIGQLNLDELGVVALGYFKTQSIITSTVLIRRILAKAESNFHQLNNFNLTSISKIVRYSLLKNFDCLEECKSFQKKALSYLPSFSSPTILHLALLNIKHGACDEDLLKYMMVAFGRDLKSIRLKEFSQSLFCVSEILPENEISREYAEKVIGELLLPHRKEELVQYPHQVLSLILYAAYVNVFSAELIDLCLNDDFLTQAEDNATWQWERETYVLDESVGIECNNYQGSRMSKPRKSAIFKRTLLENKTSSRHNTLISDVSKNVATVLGGNKYCQTVQILPHFHHNDVVAIRDKNGAWKQLPSHLHERNSGIVLRPSINEQWFAFFVGGRNSYNLTNNQLIGSYRMKCRQLTKLGYKVIEVYNTAN